MTDSVAAREAIAQANVQREAMQAQLESIRLQYGQRLCAILAQILGVVFGIICVLNLKYHFFTSQVLMMAIVVTLICCFCVTILAMCIKFDLTEPFGYPQLQSFLATVALLTALEIISWSLIADRQVKMLAFGGIMLIFLLLTLASTIQYVLGGPRQALAPMYCTRAASLLAAIVVTILLYTLMLSDIISQIYSNKD